MPFLSLSQVPIWGFVIEPQVQRPGFQSHLQPELRVWFKCSWALGFLSVWLGADHLQGHHCLGPPAIIEAV